VLKENQVNAGVGRQVRHALCFGVMGSGVFISVLAFELTEEAHSFLGFITATGFFAFFLLMKTGW
jgi:hypothetical protein